MSSPAPHHDMSIITLRHLFFLHSDNYCPLPSADLQLWRPWWSFKRVQTVP